MKAVIDRFEGMLAVLLLGDGRERRVVPRASLPRRAKEGSWLTIEMAGDQIVSAVVDKEETARAAERIAAQMEQLRASDTGERKEAMKTYRIAHTDLEVSRIALGCMHMGGGWDRTAPDRATIVRAAKVVATAREQGITFFDHADIYAQGKSEAVFGEVMRQMPGLRDEIVLQSKCGIRFGDDPEPGDPHRYDFSYRHIVQSVEGSLRRLGTDRLDILLLHRPDPLVEPEEVARAFDDLQHSGKVRYFGVSNHTAGQIELLRQAIDQPLVANQVELNLLHSHLVEEGILANQAAHPYPAAAGTLDYCRLHSILVQAWSPVARGILSDPPEDAGERVRNTAVVVAKLAAGKGTTREAIVLAWLLRHPAGIQPILGTTNPDRVVAGCLADGVDLSREEWYSLLVATRGGSLP